MMGVAIGADFRVAAIKPANAFAKPVDGRGNGLVVNSVEALVDYRNRIEGMYGSSGIKSAAYATTEAARLGAPDSEGAVKLQSVEELLARTMETLGGAR